MVEILASDLGNFMPPGAVFKADLDAWINSYQLPVTSVRDPDAMQGTTLSALARREIAYIVDLSSMKVVQRIDGSTQGQGASAVKQAIPIILALLANKSG